MLQQKGTNEHRRKHLLACLRNICFEYEKYEADFDQMDLLEQIVKLLIVEQGLTTLPPDWEHMNGVAAKEKFLKQIDMDNTREILDALVLLINSEKFLQELNGMKFD